MENNAERLETSCEPIIAYFENCTNILGTNFHDLQERVEEVQWLRERDVLEMYPALVNSCQMLQSLFTSIDEYEKHLNGIEDDVVALELYIKYIKFINADRMKKAAGFSLDTFHTSFSNMLSGFLGKAAVPEDHSVEICEKENSIQSIQIPSQIQGVSLDEFFTTLLHKLKVLSNKQPSTLL